MAPTARVVLSLGREGCSPARLLKMFVADADFLHRVPREKLVRWASVATLGPQVPPGNRGSRALLEKKGQR